MAKEVDSLIRDLDRKDKSKVQVSNKSKNTQNIISVEPPNFIEKYIQISDFLQFILDNPDVFIEAELEMVADKTEEKHILERFLLKFMLEIQVSIDFETSMKTLIENERV